METESWLSCEKTAVLQGGFLLAEQLCRPAPLSALKKGDWSRVGCPVLRAVGEICGGARGGDKDGAHWRRKIVCILWSKLLEMEKGENIDIRWRDSPFFSAQNSIPAISYTVLFELVKSMGYFQIYAELLLCFPTKALCGELARLAAHVTSDTTAEDVQLLLEVWWELWRGKRTENALDQAFAALCVHYATPSADLSPQAAKRFKSDSDKPVSPGCVPSVLFRALTEIKGCVRSSDVSFLALSNCLDTLYTSFLLDNTEKFPAELNLQSLAREVRLREMTEGGGFIEVIRDSQKDLAATRDPSQFRPCGMELAQAAQTVCTLIQAWRGQGLLKTPEKDVPDPAAFRLKLSLLRVISALEGRQTSGTLAESERQNVQELKDTVEALSVPDLEYTATEMSRLAIAIIDHRLDGYKDVAPLFASDLSWASSGNDWIGCLERNKDAFQNKELILKLVSTLAVKCQSESDIPQCKKLKAIVMDIFSGLPLPDKNETLAGVLTSWGKTGLSGFLPQALSEGFSEELNLAFNSIIQSKAESSLSLAVSAVACIALQNPEAALERCCHLAVVNLGAHALLAKILRQLPGLMYRQPPGVEAETHTGESLLCRCLKEAAWSKLSSPKEEEGFLHFLVALMAPSVTAGQTTAKAQSFLPPVEALNSFVLPFLCPSALRTCSVELSLQVLLAALKQETQVDSAHWVMGCSPFPLLFSLCQLLDYSCRCWDEPAEGTLQVTMETKELLVSALTVLGELVGREIEASPSAWSRALSWLYSKVETLDWTVRFHLRPVWGGHFKREVPCSLLAVCELPEHEWSGLKLPEYGLGTGLLAWAECCCLSDEVRDTLLSCLALDQGQPEDVNMFGKGLMVALTQTLPWCTTEEWGRLMYVVRKLLESGRLHVPYSLEYVDFLPLLDLRPFAGELRLSVLLLRVFQLLSGPSCADWLPPRGWVHVGRLYAHTVRETVALLMGKSSDPASPKGPVPAGAGQEVLFVLTQMFCHVTHVQVMLPGPLEPLFFCALEMLTQCEAVLTEHPSLCSPLERDNTRRFLSSISDNLDSAEMKAALQQKIAKL